MHTIVCMGRVKPQSTCHSQQVTAPLSTATLFISSAKYHMSSPCKHDCSTNPQRADLLQIQSNGLAALQRLDARLTSLGDSLARLEKAQEESVEHGQQEILDALSQAESSLQVCCLTEQHKLSPSLVAVLP